eukprot:m51a1_g5852 putative serine-threonine protein (851) ;mRNA; f:345844-350045
MQREWDAGETQFLCDLARSTNIVSTTWRGLNPCNWTAWEGRPLRGIGVSNNRISSISLYWQIPHIKGTIPPSIGNLKYLQELNMEWNSLRGTIPDTIRNMSYLSSIKLTSNELSGTIPGSLATLPLLRSLSVGFNNISGTIPPAIYGLPLLQDLNVNNNTRIGGTFPTLAQMSNLRSLALTKTSISGTIPDGFNDSFPLTSLLAQNTALSGTIPPSIGNLSALKALDLSSNRGIVGTIPVTLSQLGSLESLYLSDSGLRGTIPGELGNMTWLKELGLYGNGWLEGTVPASLCDLKVAMWTVKGVACGNQLCYSAWCLREQKLVCSDMTLCESVTVTHSHQALLLTRASYLRGSVTHFKCTDGGDTALCTAVAATVCPSLLELRVSNCPELTDDALSAVAFVCPRLLVSLYECPELGSDGCENLARTCGRTLQTVCVEQCGEGAGRGLLDGLLESQPSGALPLVWFTSDSLSPEDIFSVFSARTEAFANLTTLRVKAVVAHDDDDGSALAAVAIACPALEKLRFDHGVEATGAGALSSHYPRLTSARVSAASEAPSEVLLLVKPPLRSLRIQGAIADTQLLGTRLEQCSATLAKLRLKSLHLSLDFARSIASLPRLCSLSLLFPKLGDTTADVVMAELSKCAPLAALDFAALAPTADFICSSACSALERVKLAVLSVPDDVLAKLPATALRFLFLDDCSGCSPSGVAALLRHASHLQRLWMLRMSSALGGNGMAATIAPCIARMDELSELALGLAEATDAGALLAAACGRVRDLQVSMPLVTDAGARALLQRAARATTVGVVQCTGLSAETLLSLRPCARRLVLSRGNQNLVRESSFHTKRPLIEVKYEEW